MLRRIANALRATGRGFVWLLLLGLVTLPPSTSGTIPAALYGFLGLMVWVFGVIVVFAR